MKLTWIGLGLILLLVGCKKAPSIVGQWLDQVNENSATRYEFKADGTYVEEYLWKTEIRMRTTGKYKVDGENISVSDSTAVDPKQNRTVKMQDEVLHSKLEGDELKLYGKHPVTGQYELLSDLKRAPHS